MRLETAVPVAEGATGRLLKAFDAERGVDVAIKMLHSDDPLWVARMRREAEALKRIRHPNICQVYGTGEHQGRPCIYMQFIDGRPLTEALVDADLKTRIGVMSRVVAAVQAAHHEGIVHRDLKPHNILVESTADGLHPYVLDFGLARAVTDETLTMEGQLLGTPGYMSPEQAGGRDLDARTDIYSLGVVLFELLAGRLPQTGPSVAELLVKVISHDAPSIRSIDPAIPEPLARIVHKCLERKRRHRYRSARRLYDDLRSFLDGRPVNAPATGTWYRLRRRIGRSPALSAAVAIAVVAVAGALGNALYQQLKLRRVVDDMRYIEQATAQIENGLRLVHAKPLHDIRPAVETLRRRHAGLIEGLVGTDESLLPASHMANGRIHFGTGDYGEALAELDAAWRAGLRDPELAELLGQVHAALYFQAVAKAGRVRDDALFEQRVDEARLTHLEPAGEYLAQVAAPTMATTPAVQARLSDDVAAALALLATDAAEIWPLPRWLLAQELLLEQSDEALRAGRIESAEESLAQALGLARQAVAIGRSHPVAHRLHCRALGNVLRIRIVDRAGEAPELQPCLDLLVIDRSEPLNRIAAATAFAGRARVATNRREDPASFFDSAMTILASGEEPRLREEQHLLGTIQLTAAVRHDSTGQSGLELSAEAVANLEAALDGRAFDPEITSELATAYRALGIRLFGAGEDGASAMTRGAELLRRAITQAPDQPDLRKSLSSLLSDYAYEKFQRGQRVGDSLDEAIAVAREAVTRWPDYLPASAALARAAWTAAEYKSRIGEDLDADAELAVAAYDTVLAANPGRFATRFNQISVMLLQGDNALKQDADLVSLMTRIEQRLEELSDMTDQPDELAIQYGHFHRLRAEDRVRSGQDPSAAFAEARRQLHTARGSEIDRFAAYGSLADTALAEHRWRHAADRADETLWRADLALLEQGLGFYPDYAVLRGRYGQLAQLAPRFPGIEPTEQTRLTDRGREQIERAVAANPLLAAYFQL